MICGRANWLYSVHMKGHVAAKIVRVLPITYSVNVCVAVPIIAAADLLDATAYQMYMVFAARLICVYACK